MMKSQVSKVRSPFKSYEIDSLLRMVRTSSENVQVCADEIMDNMIVGAHETIHSTEQKTTDIHMITQRTETGVGHLDEKLDELLKHRNPFQTRGTEVELCHLHEKVDELLKHQQSFQATFDAISSKNGLLSFFTEYLSKSKANIVPRRSTLLT
jgi:hypothetical protein